MIQLIYCGELAIIHKHLMCGSVKYSLIDQHWDRRSITQSMMIIPGYSNDSCSSDDFWMANGGNQMRETSKSYIIQFSCTLRSAVQWVKIMSMCQELIVMGFHEEIHIVTYTVRHDKTIHVFELQ